MKRIMSQSWRKLSNIPWRYVVETNGLSSGSSSCLRYQVRKFHVGRRKCLPSASRGQPRQESEMVRPTSKETGGSMEDVRYQEGKTVKFESQPPEGRNIDWIGPADTDSNLRPRKYFVPEDETATERAFRLQHEDTFKWNQQFWANHNKLYNQSKERFIQKELARLGPSLEDGTPRRLSPEHLSIFYKDFLGTNHAKHKQYNIEWYQRNLQLLWPAFKVVCIRTFWKRRPRRD